MTLSDKIKRSRELMGITQKELAAQIGVSQRTIAAYESDGAIPRRSTMGRLAHALRVSVKYLSDETCTNPVEELEKDEYVEEAYALYGSSGAAAVERLLYENTALFAGGELSEEQKDEFFQSIMKAYIACKEEAKKKYGKKG